MCDYSLEHLRSIEAEKGATYKINRHLTHGIVTMESSGTNMCVVCVQAGQAVDLSDVTLDCGDHYEMHDTLTGVIVDREADFRFAHFGPYRDGIVLTNGRSFPLAMVMRAGVKVLTARNVAIPRREIAAQVPGYGLDTRLRVRFETRRITGYDGFVTSGGHIVEDMPTPTPPTPRVRERELVDAD